MSLKTSLILAFASLTLLVTRCGPGGYGNGNNGYSYCTPNVINAGMQLLVQPLVAGSNIYSMTLCSDAAPQAVFTVYGGVSESSVTLGTINVNAAMRSPHISDALSAGTTFQVTFQSSDNYFAIYQDVFSGANYVFDASSPMITPHRLPGR